MEGDQPREDAGGIGEEGLRGFWDQALDYANYKKRSGSLCSSYSRLMTAVGGGTNTVPVVGVRVVTVRGLVGAESERDGNGAVDVVSGAGHVGLGDPGWDVKWGIRT